MTLRSLTHIGLLVALACSAGAQGIRGDQVLRVTVKLSLEEDAGQNFGSLFEANTADGKHAVGAGFLGLYNTRYRADRYTLQFFVRPTAGERPLTIERLPRPNETAGAYLFEFDGKLYVTGADDPVRQWDPAANAWATDEGEPRPGRMRLADGLLTFDDNYAAFNGEQLLGAPERGNFFRYYYAHGHLCFYHTDYAGTSGYRDYVSDDEGFTKLYACPWKPGDGPINLADATVMVLPFVGEYPFAWGQLGAEVVTCSNIGGIYVFDGVAWKTIHDGKLGESYQVYSMLNTYDRMLLGQYPTGMLFEYDGESVTLLDGQPPRIEGVSGSSREAQTTAIYGGDIYVGVWPWGELWRYCPDSGEWHSCGRMFTHPEPHNNTTHPYQTDCEEHDLVHNEWGQRVTSLVPLGESMMLSTSAKWPHDWNPEWGFIEGDGWKEYGAVLRLHAPGNLSVPIKPTESETELTFIIQGDTMQIEQDGELLGSASLGDLIPDDLTDIKWGQGVFGPFGGESLEGDG